MIFTITDEESLIGTENHDIQIDPAIVDPKGWLNDLIPGGIGISVMHLNKDGSFHISEPTTKFIKSHTSEGEYWFYHCKPSLSGVMNLHEPIASLHMSYIITAIAMKRTGSGEQHVPILLVQNNKVTQLIF